MSRSRRKGKGRRPATSDGPGRLPWVTFAFAALCLGAFAHDALVMRGLSDQADKSLEEAAGYFAEHPYLEAPPALTGRFGEDAIARMRSDFELAEQRRGAPPIPHGVQRRRQEKLDGLVASALEGLSARPAQRFALQLAQREPGPLLAHTVFHTSAWQVAGNVALAVALGFYLEAAWGPLWMLLFLLGAGPASATALGLAQPGLSAPLLGASGGVAALLGAYALRPGQGPWLTLLAVGAVWLAAPVALGAGEVLGAPLAGAAPAASYALLGGGLGYGALLALGFRLVGFEAGADRDRHRVVNPLLERAASAQAAGRVDEAYAALSRALDQDPQDGGAAFALWDVARSSDRHADASRAMLQVLRHDVRRGDTQAAIDHWLELDEAGLAADADVSLLIRMATLLRQNEQPSAALSALRLALGRAENTAVASRVAQAARDLDPATAAEAAWRALGSPELQYEERQTLEALLGELHRENEEIEEPGSRWHEPGAPVRLDAAPSPAPAPDLDGGDEAGPVASNERPEPIEIDVNSRSLTLTLARPLVLDVQGLHVELDDGSKRVLGPTEIDAVAVAAVPGSNDRPVIVVDVVLNWMSIVEEPLEVIRMRGDRFDPRRLAPDAGSPLDSLRAFVERLLRRSDATPLPDLKAARGHPFASFDSLDAYERAVLMVDGTA